MSVKSVFGKYADVYDRTRRQLIPCYEEFYGAAIDLLRYTGKQGMKILDLGAGTGALAAMVHDAFPDARLTLVDISDEMIAQAQKRFAGTTAQVTYRVADFMTEFPGGPFDTVVSSLSIHHLADASKKKLFRIIYERLNADGTFINADQVLGSSDEIERRYHQNWLDRVRAAGVDKETLAGTLERMQEDRMATLADQLAWMRDAGFQEVNCWYKNFNFVVYAGLREQPK